MKKALPEKMKFSFLLLSLIAGLITLGQDGKGVDVDVNVNKGGQWYTQAWVWIVGAAVFILLLAAILRGGKKSE